MKKPIIFVDYSQTSIKRPLWGMISDNWPFNRGQTVDIHVADNFSGILAAGCQIKVGHLIGDLLLEVWLYRTLYISLLYCWHVAWGLQLQQKKQFYTL